MLNRKKIKKAILMKIDYILEIHDNILSKREKKFTVTNLLRKCVWEKQTCKWENKWVFKNFT